jgi:hypothetical protein
MSAGTWCKTIPRAAASAKKKQPGGPRDLFRFSGGWSLGGRGGHVEGFNEDVKGELVESKIVSIGEKLGGDIAGRSCGKAS